MLGVRLSYAISVLQKQILKKKKKKVLQKQVAITLCQIAGLAICTPL